MFGGHLSIAGGLHLALLEAQRLDMDCVQVFTKNQRQWKTKPLTDAEIQAWRTHRQQTGIEQAVSHDSYLINLGGPDSENREKSMALFRDELERCEALDIAWLVTHPGAHLGEGEERGLRQVIAALDQIHRELPGYRTVTCLEVTAGQGTTLGHRIEHLRTIIEGVAEPERLAVCLDTAHLLAAGYDLTSDAGMRATLKEVGELVGLERVKVWHLNDSKTPRGSRVDRHTHIGHGHVSLQAFAVIVNHESFKGTPKILETPKEDAADGRSWDTINLDVLRELMQA